MVAAAQFWDKLARKYAKSPIRNEEAYELTLERVRSYLGSEDEVLELGCGTGTTALKLRDAAKSIVATDFAPTMIEIAEEKRVAETAENVRFEVTSVGDLAAMEEQFDRVMGFNLFHLVDEPEEAFRAIHGLLKEDGLFISKTVCLGDGPWIFRVLLWGMKLIGYAPKPVHVWRVAQLDKMIEAAGFQIIETGVYPARPPSRFVVAKKV